MKIILSGSGINYPAHVGALHALEGQDPTHIVGTSGGALVAALRASGYSPKNGDLQQVVLDNMPGPNDLLDYSWMPWLRFGVIKGDKILKMLRQLLPATFGEAYDKTGMYLGVVTTNLETASHCVWNSLDTPNADLPLTVRASMSLPLIFKYVVIDGFPHVDGGVASNFPLDFFGTGGDVFGVQIGGGRKHHQVTTFKGYISAVIDSFIEASTREHIEDAVHARIIRLDIKGSGTDFDMSDETALEVINTGFEQTARALTKMAS
jgi:NTE family protein